MLTRYWITSNSQSGLVVQETKSNEPWMERWVKEKDILPLLREARWAAELVKRSNEGYKNHHAVESVKRAQALLDATAAIEEEKGVEG